MVARPFPRPFGKYTLLASLGRGGMGEVFAASLTGGIAGIEKRCVVKTLHAIHADDREHVARFLDEARLTVRLNHRNICPVFDVGVVDTQHYLAMELVRGRDLRTIWNTAAEHGRPIDRGLALHIVTEVLDALDYAHQLVDERGQPLAVVHRDVSPQNIMVSFDGDVKVIDFGLAASAMKVERTETNVVLGKVPYMPPEQVRGERPDARADVFAAGVVLFEFITGRRFYDGVDPYNLPAVVASGAHLPPGFHQLDPDLRAVLWRAINGDRNRRTRSAGLFAEELRIYVATHGVRADAAALRTFMRDLFGGARDPWDTSASMAATTPLAALPPTIIDGSGALPVVAGDDERDLRTETDVVALARPPSATGDGGAAARRPGTQSITVPLALSAPEAFDALELDLGGDLDADLDGAVDVGFEPTGRTERLAALPAATPSRHFGLVAIGSVAFLVLFLTVAHNTRRPAAATTADAGTTAAVDAGAAPAIADAGAAPAIADAGAAPAIVDAGAAPAVVDAGAAVDGGGDGPRRRAAPVSRRDEALKRVEKAAGSSPGALFSTLRNVCGPSLCGELPRDDTFAARVEECRRRCVEWLQSR